MESTFVRVGLTGGIAAGKSTVASALKKHGIKVVNLDTVGRNLVEESSSLGVQISEICGPQVLKGTSLNRRALREHLFSHPQDRERVEKVLHPLIWNEFEKETAEAKKSGKKLIVCEAALILETGLEAHLDELVVVIAPTEMRMKRLQSRDGVDVSLATQMIGSQVDDARRRQAADYVIENSGDAQATSVQVESLVDSWKQRGLI